MKLTYMRKNKNYVLCCDKGVANRLPHLGPDQVLKLKQLTVLTLAETNKVSSHVFYCPLFSQIMNFASDQLYNLLLFSFGGAGLWAYVEHTPSVCQYLAFRGVGVAYLSL